MRRSSSLLIFLVILVFLFLLIKMYADFQNLKLLVEKSEADSRTNTEALSLQIKNLEDKIIELENNDLIDRVNFDDWSNKKLEEELQILKQQLITVSGQLYKNDKIQVSDPVDELYSRGFFLYKNEKYREALKIFSEAVVTYPDHEKLLFHYAASLYYSDPRKRSNYPYLKEQLETLRESQNHNRDSLFILAEICLSEDNLVETAQIYREILDIDKNDYQALRSLGLIEYQLGNSVMASEYFKSYLISNAEDSEIVYLYGLSLFDQEFYKQALEQFYLSLLAENPYGNVDGKIKETLERINESSEMGVNL